MTDRQPRKRHQFDPLSAAEQKVLDELDTGEDTILGDGTVPDADAGEDRRLRARFVRWLILGDAETPLLHEHGLRIRGALITGEGAGRTDHAVLDLEGAEITRDLALVHCRFTAAPLLQSARMQNLFLHGSALPGLAADRLVTQGDVVLRGAKIEGETRLQGAAIGENLVCSGATLRNAYGTALLAGGLKAQGSVLLDGLTIEGGTRLVGAEIAGGLYLCSDVYGIPTKIDGQLNLSTARLGHINDDVASWPKGPGSLNLDRCEYGAFTGGAVTAPERLRWLGLQDAPTFDREFAPQPYEHCAKVFREAGCPGDAMTILIAKESLQRAAERARMPWYRSVQHRAWDAALGAAIRYGYRPLHAGWYLLALWLIGVVAFHCVWEAHAFKPNNAFVLRADEWVQCSADAEPYSFRKGTASETQLGCFLDQPQGQGFPAFNAWVYSADVLLPVVQLEQQVHWIPDEDQPGGAWAKFLVYVQIVAGWVLSLMVVAGLTGVIKSD